MKILHVITTLGVGGAEKHLLWLVGGQLDAGHDVSVIYLKGGGELAGGFSALGVSLRMVPWDRPDPFSLRRAVKELAVFIDQWQPDIVHTHLLKADTVGTLAARRAGVDAIVSSKHNDERALLRWPVGAIHGWLAKRMVRTIALSDCVAAFTAEHGRVDPGRIRRIYYGVDAERLQPTHDRAAVRRLIGLDDDAPVAICVGRLALQKDHATLLAALAEGPPQLVLLLVGGDPFGDGMPRLQERAEELGVVDRVRFLGIRHDVPDLLGASDVFVLSSLWEGLGLVLLEAMAVGLPIVATGVSAIPEVVQDGVTGWLVPPADPAALAAALETSLADPAERRRRGEAGRQRLLEHFALPRMMAEIEAVYVEVLDEVAR